MHQVLGQIGFMHPPPHMTHMHPPAYDMRVSGAGADRVHAGIGSRC